MKLEQLAKEEAEREAARLKALIEEERKIKAEQEALRQAELAAKKIERENELQEQSHMSQEDYDVGLDNSDSEPVVEATPDESEVVEPPKPPKVELSGARLKLYNIIKRLIATKSGHKNHPRKNDSDQFFMPFNFGQDMRFDPFATDPNWTGPISLEDEDETSMPQTGYDDISKYLREKKIFLEKKTKNQLYHLNNPNIPSQDWTPMFRVDPIDWPEYFQDQLHQLKQHLDTSTNPPELHSDINYQNDKALSVRNLENVTTIVTKSSENSEKKLNPLPLGKVLQDRLIPGCDLYYQV